VSRLWDWVADKVTGMPAADRAVWNAVTTLAEQGEVTAQWLEGTVTTQPEYRAPCDVDEQDVPGMAATLAAANRAGFVTTQSQAGYDGDGYDGAHWSQHAAVVGFADNEATHWLRDSLTDTGVVVADRQNRHLWQEPVLPVTFRDGVPVTDFGVREPTDTVTADARQLVIYDPESGRNDRLWPALQAAADQRLNATDHANTADTHTQDNPSGHPDTPPTPAPIAAPDTHNDDDTDGM